MNTKTCEIVCKNKKRVTVNFDGVYVSIKSDCKIMGDFATVTYFGDVHDKTFKVVSVY